MPSYLMFKFLFVHMCALTVFGEDTEVEYVNGAPDLSLEYLHLTLSHNVLPQNSSHILPYCNALVNEYGKHSSDFIRCSVDNARPFRFCEGCVVQYRRTLTVYQDILENDDKYDNCRYILLNSDRVQVINSVHEDILHIWNSADCNKCFNPITEDENGTVTHSLTENTKQFLALYNNFTACIPSSINGTERNDTICDTCLPYYRSMNSLFDELLNDKISPHHVCMDIVDMMNYTRLTWGNQLNCTVTVKQRVPVIVVTVILLLIPIGFYTSIAVYATKKERTVMQQKRLNSLSASLSYGTYDTHFLGQGSPSSSSDVLNIPPASRVRLNTVVHGPF